MNGRMEQLLHFSSVVTEIENPVPAEAYNLDPMYAGTSRQCSNTRCYINKTLPCLAHNPTPGFNSERESFLLWLRPRGCLQVALVRDCPCAHIWLMQTCCQECAITNHILLLHATPRIALTEARLKAFVYFIHLTTYPQYRCGSLSLPVLSPGLHLVFT